MPDADLPAQGEDRTITSVVIAIAFIALLFTLGAGAKFGVRLAASVALGGLIAIANLVILARVVRSITSTSGRAAFWGGIYLLKVGALFGGVYLLFQTDVVNIYGVLVGLSALVPGIVVGAVLAAPRARP
jgi:hypothetical protein